MDTAESGKDTAESGTDTAQSGTDTAVGPGPLVIRPISEAEWDDVADLLSIVFSESGKGPGYRAAERSVFETGRSLAAYEAASTPLSAASTPPSAALVCGHTAAYSFQMTAPGGTAIPVAGVTWVGVRPTHRRRGILTSLMRRQLEDLHTSGEAVAALYASETMIYGRFGYGLASQVLDVTVPRSSTALSGTLLDASLRLRLVPPEDSVDLVESVYAAMLPRRPGMLARNRAWAQHQIFDPEELRKGSTPLYCLVAEDSGGVRGYARYATLGRWDNSLPDGVVQVSEVGALDPAAHAAVWRYLLDLDLMSTVEARLPVDDALLHMLADMRSARPVVKDGLFIRLVDVGRGLRARRYSREVDVVFDVADPFCPWNAGRWRLSAGPDGASCEPTRAPADLALTSRELGAAYLGGVSLSALAQAGRVTELRPGKLGPVSVAFASDAAPFAAFMF